MSAVLGSDKSLVLASPARRAQRKRRLDAQVRTMPIASANFPVLALLVELHVDCLDAERAIKKLRDGCRHWRLLHRGKDFDRKFPPGDVLAWASVCLSAFNRIRLMLYPGKRRSQTIAKRCAFLQKMLGNPRLEHVCTSEVRNSWEHFDERLDHVIRKPRFKSFSNISISVDRPPADTLVFRQVDAVRLTIHVLDQEIPIRPCLSEIRALNAAVVAAHDSLMDGRIVSLGA